MESPLKDLNVLHFSHPHPLQCITSPTTANVTCFGCKLSITSSKDYYHCKACNFSLHNVCYNMPIVTNHRSHSTHDLVLHVIRSSTKGTLNCVACGLHVNGFCYHCAECSIFFHTFCLALPLSLAIYNHPHQIKLEFSPPYDFFCDLCKKPSYNIGWLYRCDMCEFDTHLACAIQNLEPQSLYHPSFTQSNTLLTQITSPQVGDCRIVYEIMRLVAQKIGGGISRITSQGDSGVAGWDKRFYSPRRKNNTSSGMAKIVESQESEETEPIASPVDFSASLEEERTPLRDKLTPSSSKSTPSSYQFSEACFSIDLQKSYTPYNRIGREIGNDDQVITRSVVTEKIVNSSGQAKEPFGLVNLPTSYDSRNAESLAKWTTKDHTVTKSDSESNNGSGWWKFLSCCS